MPNIVLNALCLLMLMIPHDRPKRGLLTPFEKTETQRQRIIQGHTVTKQQSRDLAQGSLAAKWMFTR